MNAHQKRIEYWRLRLAVPVVICWLSSLGLRAGEEGHEHSHENKVYELQSFEVVSTATRTERLASEIPIRTEVVTPELLFSAGVNDLSTAIDYIPGARTEANCQNCGTTEVKLLGLGAGYNQILFDGQPLFSGLAAVYGLEHIPAAFIDRIEVVKGGGSSIYGPGAVAGVINILPSEPYHTRIQGETAIEIFDGESALSGSFVADYAPHEAGLATSLYGQWNDSKAVDLNDDGFSDITRKEFETFGMKTWAYPVEDGRLSIDYGYTSEVRRGGDRMDLLPHESQITEQLEHAWDRGGVRWEHSLSDSVTYQIGLSVSNIARDSYYGGVGDVALPGQSGYDEAEYNQALEDSRKLYGFTESKRLYLESLFNHDLGDHYLTWGVQQQSDTVFDEKRDDSGRSLRSDGTLARVKGEDPIADDTFDLFSILVQDEWSPSARWTVIGGLRADQHSEIDDWIYSPRFAVRHTLNAEWTLRSSVSTGFRAPEVFDEDFHIEILDDPTRTRNASGLKEEKSVSTAAGFIWTPQWARNRVQADVELYQSRLSDTFNVSDIVRSDPNGNAFKLRENSGKARVQGIEANLLYRFTDRIKAEIGMSYNDARFGEAQEVLPGVFEKRFLETPRLTGVGQLAYENAELFDVFLGVVYTGPMIAVEEIGGRVNEATTDFYVVDLTVAKHFSIGGESGMHLDLLAGVRNLFDERQPDLSSGPNRDTTYFYGPRYPKSFIIKARIHF